MFHQVFKPGLLSVRASNPTLIISLVIANMVFNIFSNVCFKYSIAAFNMRQFVAWQVVGNLAGFLTVITLTWMLKFVPLHVAFPLTTGLAVIGVHIIGSMLIFKEPVSNAQWLGTLAIIAGIILVTK